nr:MAG TPA_asm: PROTEIN/RNA Complex, archaeal, ribosomal, 50S, protein.0A [Caudoviricetes sp.]
MSEQETKFKFCTHEQHGGVCKRTGEYCSLSPCPNEDIEEFVPVRHGRWVLIGADKRGRGGILRCTACGECYPFKCDYCPNCGARMDGAE